MAIEKIINVVVNDTGFDNVSQKVDNLQNSLGGVDAKNKSLSKSFSESSNAVLENGGAMGLLNDATGGYAMMVKDAVEASGLFNNSLGKLGTAWTGMGRAAKLAIASTGIGALVVAVGLLISYWDDIKGAITGVNAQQVKLNEATQRNVELNEKKLEDLSSQDNILKLQGKSEEEILKIKQRATRETIKALEAQIVQQEAMKKIQVEASKRNRDILEGVLKFLSAPITLLLKTIDAVGTALGKDFGLEDKIFGNISKLIFDPEEVASEGDKTIEETKKKLAKLKNDEAGYQLSINQIREDARQKELEKEKERLAKEKELSEQRKKMFEEEMKKKAELYKNDFEALMKSIEDRKKADEESAAEQQKKLDDVIAKNEEAEALANEKQKQIVEDSNLSLSERLAALQAFNQAVVYDENLTQEQINEIKKNGAELEKNLKVAVREAGVQEGLALLNMIGQIAGEGTAIAKGAAVAQATMNTYQGITSALSAQSVIPDPFGSALKFANAAAIGVMGFLNVKKILAVKPQKGGGGGGGASGSTPQPTAPQFNIVGQNSNNQLAQTIGQQQNKPVNAFVVGNEVTTQQAADRNRVTNATFS